MRVVAVSLRDFRGYEAAGVQVGEGMTVVCGPNGAGKTNLLEGIYFGCTGCSCRTSNDRELVRFGAPAARVVVRGCGEDGDHELAVGFSPGEPKRMRVDGAPVERMLEVPGRPLVSVFLPDRLELIKGAPGLRRAHLDQFVAALWPARAATRRSYAQALAQRNALLQRIRGRHAGAEALGAWDEQLSRHGIALMDDRRRAAEALRPGFTSAALALGLDSGAELIYKPRSRADDAQSLTDELRERLSMDLERGFTSHGPHRDELSVVWGGRELRVYGSQGQQRLGLLALLLAEREVLTETRADPPLLLLDDVMSELDGARREALVGRLRERDGQAVITTTDLEHVPRAVEPGVCRLRVDRGAVMQEALAA